MTLYDINLRKEYEAIRDLADDVLLEINSTGSKSDDLFLLQMQEHFLRGAERTMLKRIHQLDG